MENTEYPVGGNHVSARIIANHSLALIAAESNLSHFQSEKGLNEIGFVYEAEMTRFLSSQGIAALESSKIAMLAVFSRDCPRHVEYRSRQ